MRRNKAAAAARSCQEPWMRGQRHPCIWQLPPSCASVSVRHAAHEQQRDHCVVIHDAMLPLSLLMARSLAATERIASPSSGRWRMGSPTNTASGQWAIATNKAVQLPRETCLFKRSIYRELRPESPAIQSRRGMSVSAYSQTQCSTD